MRGYAARCIALLAAALLSSPLAVAAERTPAKAAGACAQPTSTACRHAKGLLWKIERGGSAPSYLFGTIHVSDPRVTNLPAVVQQTFDAAQSFTMELIFDGGGLTHMAETMFFNDGRTLEDTIGAKRYAEVKRVLAARQLPLGDVNKKKPWVIGMTLGAPSQTGISLDMQLQVRATLQGKPTYGLETVREQIAVFDGMTMEDQIAMLDQALRYYDQSAHLLETLVQAYVARDLTRMMAIIDSTGHDNRRTHETFMNRLLVNRNVNMAERMRVRLDEGNAFIAVGAGHLPGERGLLMLLERAGYRLTPLY